VVQALALAGILAAVMSTIDAQFLTLSSMLSRDVIRRFRPDLSEAREVRWGRGFVLVFAVVTYALVVARPASIFSIATFSFSGDVMLVPTLYLGLAWRRFTAAGALWSIAAGNVVLLVFMFGGFEPPGDVQPVAWGLAAAIAGAIGGSMASPMSRQGRTRAARTAASEVRCTRDRKG